MPRGHSALLLPEDLRHLFEGDSWWCERGLSPSNKTNSAGWYAITWQGQSAIIHSSSVAACFDVPEEM